MTEHLEKEQLEAYSMRTLGEAETEPVEEHLLFCNLCQDQLEEIDRYHQSMKTAAIRIRKEEEQVVYTPGLLDRLRGLLRVPMPVWAGVAVMAAMGVIVDIKMKQSNGAPVQVELQAMRGTSGLTVKAGHALDLHLDNRGLPPATSYKIEIVNSAGSNVWTGTGAPKNDTIVATVPQPFEAGTFYIRVMNTQVPGVSLREYQLVVK